MPNQELFSEELSQINHLILSKYQENFKKDSMVNKASLYALSAGGKRVRPMLFALLLEAYDIDYTDYAEVFTALEMVHTYSLVHDDLPAMDDDDMRRGQPSTHKQFDEATAILAGDALLTDAFYLLSKANVSDEKKTMLFKILSLAAGSNGMVYGQDLDIANDKEERIDMKRIELTYYYKTSLMIEASLAMAACILGIDLDSIIKLGTLLGQAFQIQDDILEYTKSSEQLGKSNESDIKNDKNTLTKLIGLDHSQLLIHQYFDQIDAIIDQLHLHGSKLNLYILYLANREK